MSIKIDDIVYTGSSGSIGSYMPEGTIPLHTRLENAIEDMKKEIHSLSIRNWAFIHLAGMATVIACEKDPRLAWALNVHGAAKWFEAAIETGCKHFVLVSSSHVFSPPESEQPLTSEAAVGPTSVYGKTKLGAEKTLRALADQHPHVKLTIARVFSVLSDTRRPGFLLTGLHERAQRQDFSPIPGLSYVRDFLKAPEICRRLVKVAKRADCPDLVLICSGKGRPVREIAQHVFEQYGLDVSRIREAARKSSDIPYLVGVPSNV